MTVHPELVAGNDTPLMGFIGVSAWGLRSPNLIEDLVIYAEIPVLGLFCHSLTISKGNSESTLGSVRVNYICKMFFNNNPANFLPPQALTFAVPKTLEEQSQH